MARKRVLTPDDLDWIRECYESSLADCDPEDGEYEGEAVMTSIGYVDVDSCGDIWGYGQHLGNVAPSHN